jgi:hypothetical protein
MPLAALVVQLTRGEAAMFAALDAADTALAPLRAAVDGPVTLPEEVREALDGVSRDPAQRARVRQQYRDGAVHLLLQEAGRVYGAPGVPFTVTEQEVRTALRATRYDRHSEPLDLAAVAAYLDRAFGGCAGAERAENELREAVASAVCRVPYSALPVEQRRLPRDEQPILHAAAPRGYGAVALWASSERRSAGGRQYSYHTREKVPRALAQIGQALALLGESVDQDRLREVTRPPSSRLARPSRCAHARDTTWGQGWPSSRTRTRSTSSSRWP